MDSTVVMLLRALVSLGAVLGLIWWAGRRLSSGKGRVGGTTAGTRPVRAPGAPGGAWARVRSGVAGLVRRGDVPEPAIVVVGRQSLTPRAGLALVEVGGRRLLLGVGDQGITVLDTQDAPAPAAPSAAAEPETLTDDGDDDAARSAAAPEVSSRFEAELGLALVSSATTDDADAEVADEPEVGDVADEPEVAADRTAAAASVARGASALDGSILSPQTWHRAKEALQAARR